MTDRKLTYEEIIKDLKFCEDCSANINIDIIDFINRQESEIERLQKEVNLVSIQFQDIQERQEESQAEIERLKGSTIVNNIMESQRIKREAKAEAYKEFAERLKDKIIDTPFGINCTIDMVDNLLKEMVGEKE